MGSHPQPTRPTVVLTTVSSDAHTWNLIFVQLLLEEMGVRVENLGPCPPDDVVLDACLRLRPAMLVVSTVNGHGWLDGVRLMKRIRTRAALDAMPAVIGGKLGIRGGEDRSVTEALLRAGFDMVFEDGVSVESFRHRVAAIAATPSVMESAA